MHITPDLSDSVSYPVFSRDEGVEVHSGSIVSLNAADVFGPQESEERVVLPVLDEVHGVPRDRIVHGEHEVQHVALKQTPQSVMRHTESCRDLAGMSVFQFLPASDPRSV